MEMVSVAGLAPARVGLKIRLRELLRIHGRNELQVAGCKFTRRERRRNLQSVTFNLQRD
jgi:hypothetical protein